MLGFGDGLLPHLGVFGVKNEDGPSFVIFAMLEGSILMLCLDVAVHKLDQQEFLQFDPRLELFLGRVDGTSYFFWS